MGKELLTEKEKTTLYGIVRYPNFSDKQLSEKIELKHSTVTSIRHRLRNKEYFRSLIIPRLQNMGCNMLVAIYTNFSPLIPLEERVKITGKTIEVFEEIFFSVGEQDKGFSLSLSKDYSSIGRINDIRTQTFGSRGLLEDEYPNMVVFPFEISKIYRFFDFAPLFKQFFSLNKMTLSSVIKDFGKASATRELLSDTEKKIYCNLVKYPELSDNNIGDRLGVSRHTVSRIRRVFEKTDLIRRINLPNLKKLGFDILTFHHIRFDPRNPPDMDKDEAVSLMSDSTIFMASRRFESVMISVHSDFDDYKRDSTRINQVLKENNWIAQNPLILTYSLNDLYFIKEFSFVPIARKILECNIDY